MTDKRKLTRSVSSIRKPITLLEDVPAARTRSRQRLTPSTTDCSPKDVHTLPSQRFTGKDHRQPKQPVTEVLWPNVNISTAGPASKTTKRPLHPQHESSKSGRSSKPKTTPLRRLATIPQKHVQYQRPFSKANTVPEEQGPMSKAQNVVDSVALPRKRKQADFKEEQASPHKKLKRIGNPFAIMRDEKVSQYLMDIAEFRDGYPKALLKGDEQECNVQEIALLLRACQESMHTYIAHYFSFTLTMEQQDAWPLHRLETHYPQLFLIAQYVADGSQAGWRCFFTRSFYRQHLVAAIIGEWISQHILKSTAFGLPLEHIQRLERQDREFVHYDAFVRTERRAKLLDTILRDVGHQNVKICLREACEQLADQLLDVLHPLLPPKIFDPLSPGNATSSRPSSGHGTIRSNLVLLLQSVAAVNLCIKLSGITGTVIRVVPHQPKGTRFSPQSASICVNQDDCNDTRPDGKDAQAHLRIKMTCWPRIEAIVPHGPNILTMEHYEADVRRTLKVLEEEMESRLTSVSQTVDEQQCADHGILRPWKALEQKLWPVVPPELQASITRKLRHIEVYDGARTSTSRLSSKTDHQIHEERAAYVTIYPEITPASVYLEWTPHPPPPSSSSTSLSEAVALARASHTRSLMLNLEDGIITIWNHYALYGGLYEWALTLTAATAYGIHVERETRIFRKLAHLVGLVGRSCLRHLSHDFNRLLRGKVKNMANLVMLGHGATSGLGQKAANVT